MIRRLTIIGTGLIGGSLALALRQAGQVDEIVGGGRNAKRLQRAVDLNVIDRFETDLAESVRGADMVVIATPLSSISEVFEQVAAAADSDAVITDVGSAKCSVIADAERVLGDHARRFVPGHPIAGAENSGVEAALPDLFQRRRVILTPTNRSDSSAVEAVSAMWAAAGAEVTNMDAAHHDEVLAATSHLPHLLAFGLVDTLAQMEDRREIFAYAAGGFRDFTRIAASDPIMWRDICLANREQLLQMTDRFSDDLGKLRALVDTADGEGLQALFSRAQTARRNLNHLE